MHIRPPRGVTPTALRRAEPVALHLDDLAPRLGARLGDIRAVLESESELAVVTADREADGDECVLVATRSAVHVSCLRDTTGSASEPIVRVPWLSVRVSPMYLDRSSSQARGEGRYGCEVLAGDTRFRVIADDAAKDSGIEAFHDEVVRRGTPWHYPR